MAFINEAELVSMVEKAVRAQLQKPPEYPKERLTEALCERLTKAIEAKASEMGVRTVVAICDAGGNLKFLARADGAYLGSVAIAQEKAYTSVALKMPTRRVGEEAVPGGALEGLHGNDYNRISMLGGGEPLADNGVLCGGIGVSGGSAGEDTYLAHFGAEVFTTLLSQDAGRASANG